MSGTQRGGKRAAITSKLRYGLNWHRESGKKRATGPGSFTDKELAATMGARGGGANTEAQRLARSRNARKATEARLKRKSKESPQ